MKSIEWFKKNKFKSKSFAHIKKLVQLKKEKKQTISLVIPTLNEEKNVGKVVNTLKEELMEKYPLLDEIVVVDSGSVDKTKGVVENKNIPFFYAKKILRNYPKYKGKGENIWKSLFVTKGTILVFLDGDIKNIHPLFVYGLVGPLLTHNKLDMTKSFFDRTNSKNGESIKGGGRVTEILVRPLFNMYFPRLSAFIQPLSGQFAIRRKVIEKIPIFTGYGVEIGMLIDIVRQFGLKRVAQVDLLELVHAPQSLDNLSDMSFDILQVFSKRANMLGKFVLVKDIRQEFRTIEKKKDAGYFIKRKKVYLKQRPPMITIPEYDLKFKKSIKGDL